MNKPSPAIAFCRDALFTKSQLFIKRGFRALQQKDSEEYQLWASLALELLAKSTLSSFSPALVADPTDLDSLFAACGHPRTADVKSIAAHTLFSRLSKLSKQFDRHVAKFCQDISVRRNSELHSGLSPFSGMNAGSWENQFWYATNAILEMQSKSLDDWIEPHDAISKAKLIRDANTARKKLVKARIENRRKELDEKFKDNPHEKKKRIADSLLVPPLVFAKQLSFGADEVESYECPACKAMGVVGGVLWNEEVVEQHWDVYSDEIPEETVEKLYTTEEFWCSVCNLSLKGSQEIAAAKVIEEFSRTEVREMEFEPDYGND